MLISCAPNFNKRSFGNNDYYSHYLTRADEQINRVNFRGAKSLEKLGKKRLNPRKGKTTVVVKKVPKTLKNSMKTKNRATKISVLLRKSLKK